MVFWLVGAVGLAVVLTGCAWVWYRGGIEEPAYAVTRVEEPFEIRDYPPMLAAEVTTAGSRDEAARAGFRALFRYISGRDRDGEAIAMTAPVTQSREPIAMTAPVTQSGGDGSWTVRFIMPASYTRETLPAPGGDVRIVEIPARQVAALRFSGSWDTTDLVAREAELRAWMTAQGLPADEAATYAFYDDPFTPGFLRRNEVLIPLP
jgi:hypothetical protein